MFSVTKLTAAGFGPIHVEKTKYSGWELTDYPLSCPSPKPWDDAQFEPNLGVWTSLEAKAGNRSERPERDYAFSPTMSE